MQSREKNFVNNTAILFVGRICTKLIQFLLLPLYTSVLSTTEYGTADLISTYVTILVVLVNLQIEQAIFRYLAENRTNEIGQKKVITNIFAIAVVQIIIFSFIYIAIQKYVHIDGKVFLLLNVISSIFMTTMLNITRGLGDYKTYAKASFLSAFSIIILNILLLVVCNMSVIGLLLSTFVSYMLCGLYLLAKKKTYKYIKKESLDKKLVKELLNYSIPLIPNELSWQAIKSSDKIIVSSILGKSYNGILSISTKFSSVFTEIYNIFNTSLVDTFILNLKSEDGQKFINKLINSIYVFFLSGAIFIIAVMPFIFNIFINKAYNDAYYYIPLYMLSSILNVMIGITSGVFIVDKNTKIIAWTSFLAGIINIIVDLILMKSIGLYAAALSTILGFLIMFILRYRVIRKKYNIKIYTRNFILTIIGFSTISLIYYLGNKLIKLIALLLVVVLSIYFNKDIIKMCKNYVFNFLLSKTKTIKRNRNIFINIKNRKKLKNTNFTILSNNCIAGFIYNDLNLQYLTPTANIYISPNDFVKFCKNIKKYIKLEMKEVKEKNVSCPIGQLDDIKIYFVHYKTFQEGKTKWDYRKKRINYTNLYCIMTDRNTIFCEPHACDDEIIYEFDKLPIKNKIVFTSKEYKLKSSHYLPKYKDKVVDVATNYINIIGKYVIESNGFDYVEFLNNK